MKGKVWNESTWVHWVGHDDTNTSVYLSLY